MTPPPVFLVIRHADGRHTLEAGRPLVRGETVLAHMNDKELLRRLWPHAQDVAQTTAPTEGGKP